MLHFRSEHEGVEQRVEKWYETTREEGEMLKQLDKEGKILDLQELNP
jgi:hypothetical protein